MSDAFHDSVMTKEEEIIENLQFFCEMMGVEYPHHNTFHKVEELQNFSINFKKKILDNQK